MKKKIPFIPKYAIWPTIVLLVMHMCTFYLSRAITYGAHHYDLTAPIDNAIPLIPAFIVIYILAYAQWFYGIYYSISRGKDLCYKFIAAAMIGELICITVFIAMPTTMPDPEPLLTGNDVFTKLTKLIYSLDERNNLFPSLHCFASWLCFRVIFYQEKEKRNTFYTVFSCVFSILVFASTVLVKQHVFIDIIAGVALVEISILIEKLTGAHRILYRIDRKHAEKKGKARKES